MKQEISTTSPYEANYLLFRQIIQNIQFNCTNGKKTDNDISVANIRFNKLSSSVKHAEREELNLSVLTIITSKDGWCQKLRPKKKTAGSTIRVTTENVELTIECTP